MRDLTGPTPRQGPAASTAPLAKASKHREPEDELTKAEYADALYAPQVELVKLQKHLIKGGERIVVLLVGRDAAGYARIISADRPLRAKDRNMIGCRAPRRLAWVNMERLWAWPCRR